MSNKRKSLDRLFDFLQRIFGRLFNRTPVSYRKIPKEIGGPHDCALRALHLVCPDVPIEEMKNSFNFCCDNWPYGGVSNKELNISISNLGLKDGFQYCDDDGLTLMDLVKMKRNIYIALIYGHYTVVYKGKIIDYFTGYDLSEEIFCCWRLV